MARWPGPDPARSPTDRRKQCDKQGPSCPFLRSYVFVRFPGPHKVCNKVSLQSRLLFVQGRLGNDRYPSDHALESISIILCLFFIYFFSRILPSLNAAPTANRRRSVIHQKESIWNILLIFACRFVWSSKNAGAHQQEVKFCPGYP